MMVYRWAGTTVRSLQQCNAQTVGEELKRLSKRTKLTARAIVDAAADKRSPLRPVFEWDDTKAANAYRITQAGDVLRHLMVVVQDDERGESRLVRAFVAIRDEDAGYSAPARFVVNATQSSDEAPTNEAAWDELLRWRMKYGHLKEFSRVCMAIDMTRKAAERQAS